MTRAERYARGISLELVSEVSPQFDELFARVSRHYEFRARRDATYVRWRYLSRPDVRYVIVAMRKWQHLAGWLVLRIREERMSIGDLLLDPDHADVFETALRHLAGLYPTRSVDMWCPARPGWMSEVVSALHFERVREPQDLGVMCVPFVDDEAPSRMRTLYYTMGDGDLF